MGWIALSDCTPQIVFLLCCFNFNRADVTFVKILFQQTLSFLSYPDSTVFHTFTPEAYLLYFHLSFGCKGSGKNNTNNNYRLLFHVWFCQRQILTL